MSKKKSSASKVAPPTPEPGAVSPGAADSNAFARQQLANQAGGVSAGARTFGLSTLALYQVSLDSLQPGMVETAGAEITGGWAELEAMDEHLQANIDGSLGPQLPSDDGAPYDPLRAPEVVKAKQDVAGAKALVGVRVTLQNLDGEALLGSTSPYEVGESVPLFVQEEVAKAKAVLQLAEQIAQIIENPALDTHGVFGVEATTSSEQDHRIIELAMSTETRMAEMFLAGALRMRGVGPQFRKITQGSKDLRKHSADLLEEAAITNDQQRDVDPVLLDQMQKHANAIESEVKSRMYASDSVINDALSHYTEAEDLDVFFQLLERRCLVDAMLSRGDADYVQSKLNQTTEYRGRKYNAGFDIGLDYSLSANADDIVVEMGKQAPGAICMTASGVFTGLSHIPVLGGVMGDAAKGFSDLATVADKEMGADDTGREWRNLMAKGTGVAISAMMQGGAGAELAGAQAIQVANAGAKGIDAYQDVSRFYDGVMEFKDVYDSGKLFWGTALAALDDIPSLFDDLTDDNWAGAIENVDKLCDGFMGALGGELKTEVTVGGQKGRDAEASERAGRSKHHLAMAQFADVSGRLGTSDPSQLSGADMVELQGAGAEVRNAASERIEGPQDGRMKPVEQKTPVTTKVGHYLKKKLVDLFVWMVNQFRKMLKDAILSAMGATKTIDWREYAVDALGKAAPTVAKAVVKEAISLITDYTMGLLSRTIVALLNKQFPDFGTAASGAIEKGLKDLLDYGLKELAPEEFFNKPVADLTEGIGKMILSGAPTLPAPAASAP